MHGSHPFHQCANTFFRQALIQTAWLNTIFEQNLNCALKFKKPTPAPLSARAEIATCKRTLSPQVVKGAILSKWTPC